MPNIPQYLNPIDGLTPSDKGIEANALAGRRIGSFYHQLGEDVSSTAQSLGKDYETYVSRQELSTGTAAMATLADGLGKNWNATFSGSNVNDTTTADKWRQETLEPALQEFQGTFKSDTGKRWAQEEVAQWRQHFFSTTAADMSTRAGDALITNLTTVKNRASDAALQDPSSADAMIDMQDRAFHALIGSHGDMIDPKLTSRLETEVLQSSKADTAKAAIIGTMIRDPEAGMKLLDSGKYTDLIGGDEAQKLSTFAVERQRMAQTQARLNEEEQKRQQTEAARQQALKVQALFHVDMGTGRMVVDPSAADEIFKYKIMTGAEPGRAESMDHLLEATLKDPTDTVSDPHLYDAMKAAAEQHTLTHDQVFEAKSQRMLSNRDFEMFKQWIERPKDPAEELSLSRGKEFIAAAKSSIAPSSDGFGNILKPQEAGQFYQFQSMVQNNYEYWVHQKGMSPADYTAKYLDPHSKDFLGQYVKAYMPGSIQSQAQQVAPTLQGQTDPMAPAATRPHSKAQMEDIDAAAAKAQTPPQRGFQFLVKGLLDMMTQEPQ